eukprot:358478-Chlamydomonas_euryale.AAC.24
MSQCGFHTCSQLPRLKPSPVPRSSGPHTPSSAPAFPHLWASQDLPPGAPAFPHLQARQDLQLVAMLCAERQRAWHEVVWQAFGQHAMQQLRSCACVRVFVCLCWEKDSKVFASGTASGTATLTGRGRSATGAG